MNFQTPVNVDELEQRLSKITTLTKQLSKISTKDESFVVVDNNLDDDEVDEINDDLSVTKYWKDYHDYFSTLSTIKKEISEFKNLTNEYTGEEDFEIGKYQKLNNTLEKAIRDSNKSYKDFNGMDYEYFH